MLIIGAKGLAKEVLEIFHQQNELKNIYFYDDVNADLPDKLYGQYPILKNTEQVSELFKKDNRFTIGIGNPVLRQKLYDKFIVLGGKFESSISPLAQIGHFGNSIGDGCNIMTGTIITNDITIGKGCLINLNSTIGHDCIIGEFVELSPAVNISGNCSIGNYCTIGTGAILLPKVKLGDGVTVGAGAVVTKDVEAGVTVVGMPSKPLLK